MSSINWLWCPLASICFGAYWQVKMFPVSLQITEELMHGYVQKNMWFISNEEKYRNGLASSTLPALILLGKLPLRPELGIQESLKFSVIWPRLRAP